MNNIDLRSLVSGNSRNRTQIYLLVGLIVFVCYWTFHLKSKRDALLPDDNFSNLIEEAKSIREDLRVKQPAPKIHETYKKVSAGAKFYGLDLENISGTTAEQANMYQGPMTSWHIKVSGSTPTVTTFLHMLDKNNLYVYAYHYTITDNDMDVMMSVVGNI